MVIFHSYVSLPEGNSIFFLGCPTHLWRSSGHLTWFFHHRMRRCGFSIKIDDFSNGKSQTINGGELGVHLWLRKPPYIYTYIYIHIYIWLYWPTSLGEFDGAKHLKHGSRRLLIYLVGGFNHLAKSEFVNGKDYPIFYGKIHVPNHQPAMFDLNFQQGCQLLKPMSSSWC